MQELKLDLKLNFIVCMILAISNLDLPVCSSLPTKLLQRDDTAPKNLSLAAYYGDHMVLQAAPYRAVIWGYAPPGTEGEKVWVTVTGSPATYTGIVGGSLTWTVTIGPMSVGGPHTIYVSLGHGQGVQLTDVLFGDVWLCSGQSNMEFALDQVFNATYELKDSIHYPDVRVFHVQRHESTEPLTDLAPGGISLPWSVPSPETLGGTPFDGGFSAVCWLYGKYLYQTLKKPIGMVETAWGGTPVEAWSSAEALSKCGLKANQNTLKYPSHEATFGGPQDYKVLWNGMVNPLKKMSVYGAVWYQGENNAKLNRELYNCTFPAMIDDWRKQFSENSGTSDTFPFGFVQLASFNPDYREDSGFPDIRLKQTANYGYVPNPRMKNVFMAVAMDLPDFLSPYGPIHSRDKQDVAARLSRAGLGVAYGRKTSFQGPFWDVITVTSPAGSSIITVKVDYNMAITQTWMDGFEICCAFTSPPVCSAGKSWWLPMTTARSLYTANSTTTYVMGCSLDNIVGLRYAWRDSPCPFKKCSVYGANNHLPLPPFTVQNETFERHFLSEDTFIVKVLR